MSKNPTQPVAISPDDLKGTNRRTLAWLPRFPTAPARNSTEPAKTAQPSAHRRSSPVGSQLEWKQGAAWVVPFTRLSVGMVQKGA